MMNVAKVRTSKSAHTAHRVRLVGVQSDLGLYRASSFQVNHAAQVATQGRSASNGKTLKATTGKRSSIIEQIGRCIHRQSTIINLQ